MPAQDQKITDYFHLRIRLDIFEERTSCYRQLFGEENKDFEVLLKFSSDFFGVFQSVLRESVFLHAAKILDKGSNVLAIQKFIKTYLSPAEAKTFLSRFEAIKQRANPILDFRHKTVAHEDYDFVHGVLKLESIPLSDFDTLIQEIKTLLIDIERHLFPDGIKGSDGKRIFYASRDYMNGCISDLIEKMKIANGLEEQKD